MKRLLLFVLFISFSSLIAQNTLNTTAELYKLYFNESLTIKNVRLEFKSLSPDSRCPKEVMCVRAGEVVVTLKVYIDNNFKKELQLTFYPHGISEELTGILKAENILVENLHLFPYPKADENQVNSTYYLQFNALISDKD